MAQVVLLFVDVCRYILAQAEDAVASSNCDPGFTAGTPLGCTRCALRNNRINETGACILALDAPELGAHHMCTGDVSVVYNHLIGVYGIRTIERNWCGHSSARSWAHLHIYISVIIAMCGL